MTATASPSLDETYDARLLNATTRIYAVLDAEGRGKGEGPRRAWKYAGWRPNGFTPASGLTMSLWGCASLVAMLLVAVAGLIWQDSFSPASGFTTFLAFVGLAIAGVNLIGHAEYSVKFAATDLLADEYTRAVRAARTLTKTNPGAAETLRDIRAVRAGFCELLVKLDTAICGACFPAGDRLAVEDPAVARGAAPDPEAAQAAAVDVLAQVLVACWNAGRLTAGEPAKTGKEKVSAANASVSARLDQMNKALERLAATAQ